jgi:hypothetical protein
MYKPLEDRASWFETGLKAARKRPGERPRALRRFEEGINRRLPVLTLEGPLFYQSRDSMPRCVTVLRTLQRGDLLYAVPALRAVRATLLRVEIVLVGLSWAKSLAQHFDHYLDGLLELPGYPGLREAPA